MATSLDPVGKAKKQAKASGASRRLLTLSMFHCQKGTLLEEGNAVQREDPNAPITRPDASWVPGRLITESGWDCSEVLVNT